MTVLGEYTGEIEIEVAGADPVRLGWGVASDVGRRRANNEDSAVVRPPLFAVADGMGGHSAGDLASKAAVVRLDEHERGAMGTEQEILTHLERAVDDIARVAAGVPAGAGTTVTGVVLADAEDGGAELLVFNLGDSRTYRFAGNELTRVTVDHSVVQELVDAGAISEAEAEYHPESNVITRALGFSEHPEPDFTRIPLRPGMRLLICSDGLTREVEDAHIRLHLSAGLDPLVTADALVDAALASGGRDNVTVLVVDVR
ncbi:PP2C family serine/threonine-protein phosphatase [Schumannella sp. 10F1B-5-1]|uniref:PP2C family protein-serine/threonine phosphatase n=1 Tax=Schumannella sp. 10F1B-5-1 TaxID=2590780 RepID=UPI001131A824|nr:protein phosphatase 2C domain-containing protein [Schumannella sp. 10F1B-5-1]TPW70699.1 serine/threonine-protein phosphatase [Schumannella sp. 10F1B-5-1]